MLFFTKEKIKDSTKKLIDDLITNHSDWQQSDHYYHNKKTNSKIWTSNGKGYIDFYPNIKAFNISEKNAVHKAIIESVILNSIKQKQPI